MSWKTTEREVMYAYRMEPAVESQSIRTELKEMKERSLRSRQLRRELQQKWYWSPWRIISAPLIAYVAAGLFLWMIETPDAWLRAIAPVLVVMVFTLVMPYIKKKWFKYMREKLKTEMNNGART